MAIDTVTLRSPCISEQLASTIQSECTLRTGVDFKHDTILYQITTGQLEGSFDSRISIVVKRKEWVKNVTSKSDTPTLVDCDPFLEVECSIHKLFLGHNIYGGTENFQQACYYLIKFLEQIFNIELPNYQSWYVKRIDYACVFYLDETKAIDQFFYLMKNSYYPRRNVQHFGLTGIYSHATTTTLKAYYKGAEFRTHDFKRLKTLGTFDESTLFQLLELANHILRVELEIKSRKLRYDFQHLRFGHDPYVKDISDEYIQQVYDNEINRFLKEGKKESDIARTLLDVKNALQSTYSNRTATTLLGAWMQINEMGIQEYKNTTPKATYHRHIKQFKEAHIALNMTELEELEFTELPKDFQLLRDSKYRLIGTDELITQAFNNLDKDKKIERFDKKRTIRKTG